MLGISEKAFNILQTTIAASRGVVKAKVFGSRAKGCAKEGSDIDLCLYVEKDNSFTIKDKLNIIRKFEESSLPYKVDVFVFGELQNESLKEHIELVGITIYERAN